MQNIWSYTLNKEFQYEITKMKIVRIFDPTHVANYGKTHEDPVQALEYKPNSRLIKINTIVTANMLIWQNYSENLTKLSLQMYRTLNDLHNDTKISLNKVQM